MEYKQFSPSLVTRTSDMRPINMDDKVYTEWLEKGNSPFPPDPPVGIDLESFLSTKEAEDKVVNLGEEVTENP